MKHGNKKENIIVQWHKMSDAGRQIGHSNIAEVVLGRIKKYYGKKKKNISEEEKQKCKAHILKAKKVFLLLENFHVM